MAKVCKTREVEIDEPALLVWLQHLEVAELVHCGLVDVLQLLLLPDEALRLYVESDREGQGWNLLEGEVPPEEILMDVCHSAVVHKLHLDMLTGGR